MISALFSLLLSPEIKSEQTSPVMTRGEQVKRGTPEACGRHKDFHCLRAGSMLALQTQTGRKVGFQSHGYYQVAIHCYGNGDRWSQWPYGGKRRFGSRRSFGAKGDGWARETEHDHAGASFRGRIRRMLWGRSRLRG